jgi:NarL family two-component system response regulator LiaR
MSAAPIRVLIVDDHAEVRSGLEAMLMIHDDMELVGQAGNGREAVVLAQQLQPDVVLMDLVMPDMNGVEAIRAVHECCPRARIIALSFTFPEDAMVHEARRAGAAGYLMKSVGAAKLADTIREISKQ